MFRVGEDRNGVCKAVGLNTNEIHVSDQKIQGSLVDGSFIEVSLGYRNYRFQQIDFGDTEDSILEFQRRRSVYLNFGI